MGSGTISLTSDLKSATVNLDHCQRRPGFHPGFEFPGPELFHPIISVVLQVLAHLMGHAVDLSATNGEIRPLIEGLGRPLKSGFPGGSPEDRAQDRGAGLMRREA